MLRRRRKGPKFPRASASAPEVRRAHGAPTERSRRRPRTDVPVPDQLKVRSPAPAKRHEAGGAVVLVTGFDPFEGESMNPSWEICTQLPREIAGMRVETARIPCEFRRAIEVAAAAIDTHKPSLVICLGQAGGRTHVGVERVAINVDDARIPDNAGAQPVDEKIATSGPPAYFATLPVKAMAVAMRKVGVPAEVSNTAGTFVCNHLMYGVLHYLVGTGSHARAGFIHVPYADEQVRERRGVPSMAIATMVRGIEAAIAAAATTTTDLAVVEGALD